MLAKAIHKLTALSLSLLVMLSTFSFTIEKHFCGDTLIDIAVFTQAEKCSNEAMEIEIASISKKSCCKDEVNLIKGLDRFIPIKMPNGNIFYCNCFPYHMESNTQMFLFDYTGKL